MGIEENPGPCIECAEAGNHCPHSYMHIRANLQNLLGNNGNCTGCQHHAGMHNDDVENPPTIQPSLLHFWRNCVVAAAVPAWPVGVPALTANHANYNVITLAAVNGVATYWFGDSTLGSVLIVRPEYETLRLDIHNAWAIAIPEQTLLLGTPGIGNDITTKIRVQLSSNTLISIAD